MISCLQCSYLKLVSNDYGNDTCSANIIVSMSYDANNYRIARKFCSQWHNVYLQIINPRCMRKGYGSRSVCMCVCYQATSFVSSNMTS